MSDAASHLRSYREATGLDHHSHAQWVIALSGELEFEVTGTGRRLGASLGAFVAAGEPHDQWSTAPNQFLVVDCPVLLLDDDTQEALQRSPWLAIPGDLQTRLAAFNQRQGEILSLLLGYFSPHAPRVRLHDLCERMEQSPAHHWTVEEMAHCAGLSVSRLHAVFGMHFGTSPQNWLTGCRLRQARHALHATSAPLAAVALEVGYSEQSAFSRAFRREVGVSPGVWRRQSQ
jgi:AraC-like DNA-binding protein